MGERSAAAIASRLEPRLSMALDAMPTRLFLACAFALVAGCSWNGRIPPAPAPERRLDALSGTLVGADSMRMVREPRSRVMVVEKLDFPKVLRPEQHAHVPVPFWVMAPVYYPVLFVRMLYPPAWWTRTVLRESWGYLLPDARVRTEAGDTVVVPYVLLRHAQEGHNPRHWREYRAYPYSEVGAIWERPFPAACADSWRDSDIAHHLWVGAEVWRLSEFTGVKTDSVVPVRLGRLLYNSVHQGPEGPFFGQRPHGFVGGRHGGDSLLAPWRPGERIPQAEIDSGILQPVIRPCPVPIGTEAAPAWGEIPALEERASREGA